MSNFEVSQVYDDQNCFMNNYRSELRFAERDVRNFGFLIRIGYRIYFKCISNVMYTEQGEPFQAGFICIRAPHSKSVEEIVELLEEYGDKYSYRVLDHFPWPEDFLENYD